jgi:hypothetical protein
MADTLSTRAANWIKCLAVGLIVIIIGIAGFYAGVNIWGGPDYPSYTKPDIKLANHRAVYQLSLAKLRAINEIADVNGRFSFELVDQCDRWTTNQNFILNYALVGGDAITMRSVLNSLEAKDGKNYLFSFNRERGGDSQVYRGRAIRPAPFAPGRVRYNTPSDQQFNLPSESYFPIQHTLQMLDRAGQGANFFNARLFDGNGPFEVIDANAVLMGAMNKQNTRISDEFIDHPLLADDPHPVSLAFYESASDNPVPDHEVDFLIHPNGVVSQMTLTYDDFTLRAELSELTKIDGPDCEGTTTSQIDTQE